MSSFRLNKPEPLPEETPDIFESGSRALGSSLAETISKHLQHPQSDPLGHADPTEGENYLFDQVYGKYQGENTRPLHIHLNQTDYELSSGLEQLLPSPATRYSVVKKRLDSEIATLKQQVAQYQVLAKNATGSAKQELQGQIDGIQSKLAVLYQHHEEATVALMRIRQQAGGITSASAQWRDLQSQVGIFKQALTQNLTKTLKMLTTPPARQAFEASYEHIQSIESLIQAQMAQPTPDADTLGALFLQYERAVADFERQGKAMQQESRLLQNAFTRAQLKPSAKQSRKPAQ